MNLSFIILISSIGILAAITDYFLIPESSEIRKSPGVQAFLAFSIYTNVNEILRAPKTKQGQIGPINCIRVLSMFWVILGHVIEVFVNVSNNILDFEEILDYPLTQLAENAFFSVDSFFFIGGVLLSFMWFKSYYKNKKATMAPQAWGMFYLHRIIRLSTPYYVVLLFYAYLIRPIIQNMPVYILPYPPKENPCHKNLWKNLLYIINFYDVSERCMGHIWYLAADMQMFILTPLILVPLALYPILGLIIAFIALVLSTAGNVITVYLNHYPPTMISFAPTDPKMKNFDLYNRDMYNAFWIRCQVYIMGIIVGWVLQRVKRLRIHPLINLLGWALSFALMLTVVFGLFHYFRGHQLPLFWRAAYSALSKPAWALGLTWIVISCYYGYGGPINKFMSWNIWVPLGRLSYCSYLVHLPVAVWFYGLNKNALYFSSIWQILIGYFIPVSVLSFSFALILSAFIEVPAEKLETLLLRPKPKEISEGDPQMMNGNLQASEVKTIKKEKV